MSAAACLESHVKLMQVQLWKNISRDFMVGFVFPIPLHLMFLNEKSQVIGFRSIVLNYAYMMLLCL